MGDPVGDLLDVATPALAGGALPWAVVSQVSPLQVKFPGDTASVPVSRLAAYASPAVGDRVVVASVGLSLVVLDRFA